MDINKHFKREGKVMLAICLLPILIGVLFVFAYPYISEFIKTDKCLDNGGRINKQTNACEIMHDQRKVNK